MGRRAWGVHGSEHCHWEQRRCGKDAHLIKGSGERRKSKRRFIFPRLSPFTCTVCSIRSVWKLPRVFCWFQCAGRHNRWSPYFQRVKSLSMALNRLAGGRRKFVTDSLNVWPSVKNAWWMVLECYWVFIVDQRDKGEVHSLNQECTVPAIHALSH